MSEPIVTTPYGETYNLSDAPAGELLYVNKLAMELVAKGFCQSVDDRSVVAHKTELDARCKSASRWKYE